MYTCLLSFYSVSHCTRTWPFGASMSRFNRQSQKSLSTFRTARNSPFLYRIWDSVSSRFSLSFCLNASGFILGSRTIGIPCGPLDSTGNEIPLWFVSLAGVLLVVSPNGGRCPYISDCTRVAAETGLKAEVSY